MTTNFDLIDQVNLEDEIARLNLLTIKQAMEIKQLKDDYEAKCKQLAKEMTKNFKDEL